MKSLQEYLTEELDNNACRAIIRDYLWFEADRNHVRISDKDLEKITDVVYDWYENEGAVEDFDSDDDFRDFLADDLPEMCDAASDQKTAKKVMKILGW